MPDETPSADQSEEPKPSPPRPEHPFPTRLIHRPQEIALDNPESRCTFQTGPDGNLMMSPSALAQFGVEMITACFYRLQCAARLNEGLEHLQIFEDPESGQELWFIEDAPGVVTALLPDDR